MIAEDVVTDILDACKEGNLIDWLRENPEELANLASYVIKYGKFHVGEALKAAYNNAELKTYYDPELECPFETIVPESILNAYPLENIK